MARTQKLAVKFCKTQTHMIPMTKEDRATLIQRGLTATRIPLPTFAWTKANYFSDLHVETYAIAQVIHDLTEQFVSHLPEGATAKSIGTVTKKPIDTVFVFVEDGTDEPAYSLLLNSYRHYLHRYCFAFVEQSQHKPGGTLYRYLLEESLDLPNSHYFNDAVGPSTVANLGLSDYFRLNVSIEQTTTHPVLSLRLQDKVGSDWQTTIHRAFHKDMVDKASVRSVVDFLMANFL